MDHGGGVTLVVRTARITDWASDAMRVTRRGSWLGLPDSLPRCYVELRGRELTERHFREWRSRVGSFLRTLSTAYPEQWRALFAHRSVTLVCHCKTAPCARFVIAEFLVEQGAFPDTERLK
jgi:hypothetical protein